MKILVISRNAWDDTNSIGNTLTNFFKDVKNIEFANIYFRKSKPKNNLCKHYYQISELDVARNWFAPKKNGRELFIEDCSVNNKKQDDITGKNEKKIIRIIQKYGFKLAYDVSDYIWYSKKWINVNLKNFVESFSPDIVFTFVKSAPQYYLTVRFLKETYNIPIITWIADDEYSTLAQNNKNKEINNLKYILENSTEVRGCSEGLCQYYNSIFGCNASPLYKGCDLSTGIKDYVNDPIKIVYAGNLLYGRLDIIRMISEVLEQYAYENRNVIFEIYSNTPLSDGEQRYFKQKVNTTYMGSKDYETIKYCLSLADIVLHVESFDSEQIMKTKYSFSTKIIDCMQSGSILLAVGPEEVASIDYIKKIPGACVIDNIELLDAGINELIEDSESYISRARNIREFALRFHDVKDNSKILEEILFKAMKETN